jgi:uncharacterized FlaG/YvyC family protein
MNAVTPAGSIPVVQDQTLAAAPSAAAAERGVPAIAAAAGEATRAAVESTPSAKEMSLEFEVSSELKLRVRFDEPTGRFVYMGVNVESGEIERQYPPEEALRMIARMHEIAGLTLDEKL